MPIVEIARALINNDSSLLISTLATLIVEVTLGIIVLRMKTHQEAAITIFLVLFITASICANYYGETHFFKTVHGTYHFASATTAMTGVIGSRIPKFSHRTAFNASIVIIKLLTIPIDDLSTLPGHAIILSFCIYLDYDREKHDQSLFDACFYSQEQLTKFKDLVVDDIPDSIVIITQDLARCLFANSAFNTLFEGEYHTSITECINKFFIQENVHESSLVLDDQEAQNNKRSLLEFIKDHVEIDSKRNISKTSCNVIYCKNTNSTDRNDSLDCLTSPSEYSFEVKILPLFWDEQPAVGIILHDITQQDMLLRLKTAANIQKDKILATVSHELRTPLNGIMGMIQFMQKEIKDNNIQHYLRLCSNSGHLLLGIVNSILDLNMIKANKIKLNIERLDIGQVIEDILKLFEFQCRQKGIYLKLDISPFITREVKTDRNRLSQIFLNLIGNALKFTETGGITVSVGPSSKGRYYIECSVEDTGIGIKEQDKNKLFKMFGKLEHKNTGTIVNSQGVGLGLAISDNLARLLCINSELAGINVESEYHKGSKFSFVINQILDLETPSSVSKREEGNYFKQSLDSLDEEEGFTSGINETSAYSGDRYRQLDPDHSVYMSFEKSKDTRRAGSITPNLHKYQSICNFGSPTSSRCVSSTLNTLKKKASVMIVDDNPLNITVVELLLRRHKFKVKSALSGQAAIKLLMENDYSKEPIALILMDLQMPIMDGYETSKKLKGLMREGKIAEVPIIALTANDSENDKKSCLKAGMVGHLSKPLKEEELAGILKKYE